MITRLKYSNPEENTLQIFLDNSETPTYACGWPCHTWQAGEIQAAIDSGVVIEPFITDVQTQVAAIRATIAGVEADRDAALVAGWTSPQGVVFHSDDRFLNEMMMLIQGYQLNLFPADMKQKVRTKDNKVLEMGKNEVVSLTLSIGQYRQKVYADSWALKDELLRQIEELTKPAT